jgi:hypothetical protein
LRNAESKFPSDGFQLLHCSLEESRQNTSNSLFEWPERFQAVEWRMLGREELGEQSG